jgi:hypothetical protein
MYTKFWSEIMKWPNGSPRCRQENNIKKGLNEIEEKVWKRFMWLKQSSLTDYDEYGTQLSHSTEGKDF